MEYAKNFSVFPLREFYYVYYCAISYEIGNIGRKVDTASYIVYVVPNRADRL